MKRFFAKLIFFSIVPLALMVVSFIFWLNGYVDPHYLKFASPRQTSMILGTSRSSLALCPSVFQRNGFGNIFNYSFTIAISPWGEDYYNSIVQKLDTTRHDGLFIVTVDPFSLSAKQENDISHTMLADIKNVSKAPNWDYILKYHVQPWKYLLQILHIERRDFCLHSDGWYENLRKWSAEIEQIETRIKINEYKNGFSDNSISPTRVKYLEKTIETLRQHGSVVLLRVPTSKAMIELEYELFPDFNRKMEDVASKYGLRYIDYTKLDSAYRTFDGNHLIPEDAKRFTQSLCDSIKKHEK